MTWTTFADDSFKGIFSVNWKRILIFYKKIHQLIDSIGSNNDLVPPVTKPFSEPMLTMIPDTTRFH